MASDLKAPLLAAKLAERSTLNLEDMEFGEIKELQSLLKESGFNPGAIDGLAGPLTSRAFDEFKEARFMSYLGVLGHGSFSALLKMAGSEPLPVESKPANAADNPDEEFTGPGSDPVPHQSGVGGAGAPWGLGLASSRR